MNSSSTQPGSTQNAFARLFRIPEGTSLGRELMSSVVVFLVALPLCMGIAIASGVPPAMGLISGIVGGVVVGMFAGAPLQVSGPAAGLAVLVWQMAREHGLQALALAVLGAGLIQLISGVLKLGRWFRAVSPAVISGMLAGIGVLILTSQFHVMLDHKPPGGGLTNLVSIPGAVLDGLYPPTSTAHHLAAAVGVLTIGTILAWNTLRPKQLKMIPAPLVAVLVATLVASLMGLPVQYVSIPENLFESFRLPEISDLSIFLNGSFLLETVAIAFIASAETLLCVTAVDRLHSGPRANYDKELAAQGLGNMLCGVLGALPVTGVIVRSSVNVEAGSKTRIPAVVHGLWLLAFVVALPWMLEKIPTAALAAVLVYTGFKLINVPTIRKLAKAGRGELGVYVSTVVMVVAVDLLTGVLVGFVLSAAKLLYTFSKLEVVVLPDLKSGRIDVSLEGAATFVRLPDLANALEKLPKGSEVHIHFGALAYIDHGCLELVERWGQGHVAAGGKMVAEWDRLRARGGRNITLPGESMFPQGIAAGADKLADPAP